MLSSRTPLKVVEPLPLPAVSAAPAEPLLVTVPLPASNSIALENPFKSSVPVIVKAKMRLNAVAASVRKVAPLAIVLLPVYVLICAKVNNARCSPHPRRSNFPEARDVP